MSGATSLGFAPDARLLIVNLDDFGMYHGVNVAVVRSIEAGIGTSCSLMPPCPGAAEAISMLRQRPGIPFGIHLTLFCDTPRRPWGPLVGPAAVPSLLDGHGRLYGPADVPRLLARARLDEVEAEFRRQLDVVAAAGLTPTHLDWHCLADGGRDDIFELTVALADEHGLAVRAWLEPARRRMRGRGVPVVDNDFLDSFSLDLAGKADRYARLLRELPPGLTEWALHPGTGDAEARAIDPGWQVRRTDYDFLTSPAAHRLLADHRITPLTHHPLRP